MKKFFILLALLGLSFSLFSCGGGGAGHSNSPEGENPGVPTIVKLLPSHFFALTNSVITLHARVLDGNGKPIRNLPVKFTNLSPVGVLSATSANTDTNGLATVTIKSTVEGFATIQVEVNKGVANVRDRKTVFFTNTLALEPFMYLDVDGDNDGVYNETSDVNLFETTTDNQVIIRATVFNRFGQRASLVEVTFGSDSSEASFPLGSTATTDTNGEAFVLVQVDPAAIRNLGTVLNITADADNDAVNMVSLFLQPVVVSTVNVTADPQVVATGDTSTITAAVILNTGHPAPDGTTVSFIASCGTVTPFAQTTDGVAEAEFTAPVSEGTCTVTATAVGVSDAVDILVTTDLTVFPGAITVSVDGVTGQTATFTIFGGIPPYTIFTSNPSFLPVPDTVAASGDTFDVTVPATACPTAVTYTIRDSGGTTVTAQLTITTLLSLSIVPASVDICENDNACPEGTETAAFTITGGVQPYNTVSDTTTVIANPGAAATFTVDAIDNSITADATVNLATTDSCGNTVTATVNVDNQP